MRTATRPKPAIPTRAHSCDGFTLLEIVVAMSAASILLVALSSALFLTLQATKPDVGGHQSRLDGAGMLVDLTNELRFARSFTLRNDKAVEFTVADRTGDTNDETIRWEWSGTPGDPLTRQFNGGAVVNYLENVHDFQLAYNIKSLTTVQNGSGPVTSDEFMLANFEGWPGVSPDVGAFAIGTSTWAAEYFAAQGLPADLTSMSITKVSLRMRKYLGGMVYVAIHEPIGGGNVEPLAVAVGTSASIDASTLPISLTWVDFAFTDVTFNTLTEEFVIVLNSTSSNAARVEYYSDRRAPADSTVMLMSTDAGANWEPAANKRDENDMLFKVYGTYTVIDDAQVEVTRYFVVSGDVDVQVGGQATNRSMSATEIVNRPEVSQP